MTIAEGIAEFAREASWQSLSEAARLALKVRVLDSLGCAIGALADEPPQRVRAQVEELDGQGPCTLIGGGQAPPDRAALYNGALIRELDFNDTYFARGETCHPSDNLGALLAAAEFHDGTGSDLLTALAVAYQVQCRLSDEAPVRDHGFDHTTQGAYALAAGLARALELEQSQAANAVAICGTAFNALRVTRTGRLSNWKGLAYPNLGACCVNATFLAKHGLTGPLEVVEGEKGFIAAIAGPFEIDWSKEDLDRVLLTALKRHNAEAHSQTAIEAALKLRRAGRFSAADIARVEVEIFDVAHKIIGGGEEGDKTLVQTKEQADHSLPYLVAVAFLDGQVLPAQFSPERIRRPDVQALLRRVIVKPLAALSARFPKELPCRMTVVLRDGRTFSREEDSYPGFLTRPMSWSEVLEKFEQLSAPFAPPALRRLIAEAVVNLGDAPVSELTRLLGAVARKEEESWRRPAALSENAPSGF